MENSKEELLTALGSISSGDFEGNGVQRLKFVEAAKKLVSRLETNVEKIFDITFAQPAVFAALQTCLDLGLWEAWTAAGGGAKSVEELSKLCKQDVDPNLARSVNIVEQTGADTYKTTLFSLTFGDRNSLMPQSIQCRTHHWQDGCVNLPKYLAKIGYKEPQDAKNTNYADWCPEKLDFFSKCVAEPAYQDSFSGFMTAWATYKLPWPEFFDTKSLVAGADLSNGGVLCVDIGGHHGLDLTRLLNKHPDVPAGSLVLEDLPEVVSGAKNVNGKIKVLPHDMFQSQPVKGSLLKRSRAYYFHAVFHDWPDNVAVNALRNTADAMRKGYSKLLINDMVLPPTGASATQATMDVEMMAIVSAYERTEAMWTSLLNDAGFEIIKIWADGRGNESVIEAELA
ncbi:Uu.00g123600.m01.CDS01 [Anthostomella pinea]|uniref:Uu.00g123600.m01.CDS01 n=1 Tax=Anthostomella pinea TaxID=933095 RepID=A0AAI8YHJ0_9PEZI|nr:Uu.00g123600.m01.CDS01 [Anthostomella pinea]